MKKKILKKTMAILCITAMSVPMASSVGAAGGGVLNRANHQQKTMDSVRPRIAEAVDMIDIFLEKLKGQAPADFVGPTANEIVKLLEDISSFLSFLYDRNLDDEDITPFCESLKSVNKCILSVNTGNVAEGKLEEIKEELCHLHNYCCCLLIDPDDYE